MLLLLMLVFLPIVIFREFYESMWTALKARQLQDTLVKFSEVVCNSVSISVFFFLIIFYYFNVC